VDDAAHIIVAAELTNNASDAGELPTMLQAVQANLGALPDQALAYRHQRSTSPACGTAKNPTNQHDMDAPSLTVALRRC
jgi:predicted transcriptional regulator